MSRFDLNRVYIPTSDGNPFLMKIEEDQPEVQIVFRSEGKARTFLSHRLVRPILRRLGGTIAVTSQDRACDFVSCYLDRGIRIVVDPFIVHEHETQYHEVVEVRGRLQYKDASNERVESNT